LRNIKKNRFSHKFTVSFSFVFSFHSLVELY
jgi:hypothetical protein